MKYYILSRVIPYVFIIVIASFLGFIVEMYGWEYDTVI